MLHREARGATRPSRALGAGGIQPKFECVVQTAERVRLDVRPHVGDERLVEERAFATEDDKFRIEEVDEVRDGNAEPLGQLGIDRGRLRVPVAYERDEAGHRDADKAAAQPVEPFQ